MNPSFIEFRDITKTFGGVVALDKVSLQVAQGECHALMGENGAGKSTLGKALARHPPPGRRRHPPRRQRGSYPFPTDASRLGIGMVHQELAFCPDLSVAENLALGHYPRSASIFLSRREMVHRAVELLGRIGTTLDVRQPLRNLSTAEEQMVQIAAAIGTGPRFWSSMSLPVPSPNARPNSFSPSSMSSRPAASP